MNLERLVLRILADASQYHRTLNTIARATASTIAAVSKNLSAGMSATMRNLSSGVGATMRNMSGMVAAWGRQAGAVFQTFGQQAARAAFRRPAGGTGGAGGSMFGGGLIGNVTQLAAAMGLLKAATTGLDALWSTGKRAVTLAANYEDAVTSFRVMTGDAATGKKLLDDIQQLAAATPYKATELTEQGQKLLGAGVDPKNILPALKQIGEITAAMGGGSEKFSRISKAYTDVLSMGRMMGEESRQFGEAGVGIQFFAETMGVSTAEFLRLREAGEVGSDVMIKTFNRLTAAGGRFSGLQEELAKNSNGLWNNMTERLDIYLRRFGDAANAGLARGGVWAAADKILEDMKGGSGELAANVAAAFENVGVAMVAARGAWDTVADIGTQATAMWGELMDMIGLGDARTSEIVIAIGAIPAAMQSVFYSLRGFLNGTFLPMLIGFADGIIRAFTDPIERMTGKKLYDTTFRDEWVTGLQQTAAGDLAKSPLDEYFMRTAQRMAELNKVGVETKSILKEIGEVKIDEPLVSSKMQKFLDDSNRAFGKRDPLAGIGEKMGAMLAVSPFAFDERMGRGRRGEEFAFAGGDMVDDLRKFVGKGEIKNPSASYSGSADAQDIINKTNQEQVSVATEIKNLVEQAVRMQAEKARVDLEQSRALIQELRRRNMIPGRI